MPTAFGGADFSTVVIIGSALISTALIALAFRAYRHAPTSTTSRTISWPWLLGGLAALAPGIALWGDGNSAAQAVVNCLAGVIGAALSFVAVRDLTVTVLGEKTTQAFKDLAGAGAGIVAAVFGGFLLAMVAGWGQPVETLRAHGFFENNFEFFLILVGFGFVLLGAWLAKAWANSTQNPTDIAIRRITAIDASVIFACIIGVSIFVAIGSSAFAARLAQQQLDRSIGTDARVPREVLWSTVENIIHQEEEKTVLDSIVRQATDDENLKSQAAMEAASAAQRPWEDFAALACVQLNPICNEEEQGRPDRVRRRWESTRNTRDNTQPAVQSVETALQAVIQAEASARQAANNAMRAQVELTRAQALRTEQQSQLDATYNKLAVQICTSRVAADMHRSSTPPSAPEDCAGTPSQSDLNKARLLVGDTRPLYRSPMSEVLARRASIILSLELVLVMGALGVLIQVISSQLTHMTKPETRDTPMTLLRLCMQILFGVATALAMFVLLNIAVDASSLTGADTPVPHGEDLNPFAMAALGLLGGFAALRVAEWMDGLAVMAMRLRNLEDQVRNSTGGAGNTPANPNNPAGRP